MYGDRELIPAASVEKSPIPFLVSTDTIGTPSTPLLEEERDLLLYGLAPDAVNPFRTHRIAHLRRVKASVRFLSVEPR